MNEISLKDCHAPSDSARNDRRWFREFLRRERVMVIISVLVFVVSLGYALAYRIPPVVDARAYDTMGWNIAQGHGFRFNLDVPLDQDDAMTYQGPLYEFFLGGIYRVVGHQVWVVWVAHALLRVGSVWFIYLLCVEIFGKEKRRIGWIAAALFGFYPDLIEAGAMLMTETLFLFLSVATLWAFARAYRVFCHPRNPPTGGGESSEVRMDSRVHGNGKGYGSIILLASIFSLAVLTRSTIGAFLPFFLFWMLRQRAWKHAIVFCGVLGLFMAPWAYRNYTIYHRFIPTMANFGYNLYVGNRIGYDGEGGNAMELETIFKERGVIGANQFGIDYFKTFVREHPVVYTELTVSRAMKYFSFVRPIGFWGYFSGLGKTIFIASSVVAGFIIFVLGFAGILYNFFRSKNSYLYYLCGFALVTCLPIIAILVETRYRFPIYPFLAIFAGFVVSAWFDNKKAVTKYLLAGLGIVFVLGGIDASLELPKILERIKGLL